MTPFVEGKTVEMMDHTVTMMYVVGFVCVYICFSVL